MANQPPGVLNLSHEQPKESWTGSSKPQAAQTVVTLLPPSRLCSIFLPKLGQAAQSAPTLASHHILTANLYGGNQSPDWIQAATTTPPSSSPTQITLLRQMPRWHTRNQDSDPTRQRQQREQRNSKSSPTNRSPIHAGGLTVHPQTERRRSNGRVKKHAEDNSEQGA